VNVVDVILKQIPYNLFITAGAMSKSGYQFVGTQMLKTRKTDTNKGFVFS
jgi:hypothetical protein